MKIKSLLVAGLCVVAMNAMAENHITGSETKITFDTEVIKNATVGEKTGWFPMTLTIADEMSNGLTNAEFQLQLPEGVTFTNVKETDETIAYNPDEDDDLQAFSWTGGMIDGNIYRCAGVNLKKTPIMKTEFKLCQCRALVASELQPGAKAVMKMIKLVDYDNNDYTSAEYEIVIVPENPDVAVANINAGKAVAGVKYYNVAGQAADSAFEGVNIVVTTYADGTQNVVKVVK